jgi:hypothetical protein
VIYKVKRFLMMDTNGQSGSDCMIVNFIDYKGGKNVKN